MAGFELGGKTIYCRFFAIGSIGIAGNEAVVARAMDNTVFKVKSAPPHTLNPFLYWNEFILIH